MFSDCPPAPCGAPDTRARPAKQVRSEQTRNRLLQTGVALLADGGFDAVSIAQIAASSGCSVGAFYQRFRNKQAYFEFLLDGVIDRVRAETAAQLTPERAHALDLPQTLALCVRQQMHVIGLNAGLIRAALAYSMNGSGDWQPIRDIGVWLNAHYLSLLVPKATAERGVPAEQAARQLSTGMRVISGFLVDLIIHKSTAHAITQPGLEDWLKHMVLSCLQAPPNMPSPAGLFTVPPHAAWPVQAPDAARTGQPATQPALHPTAKPARRRKPPAPA